MRETLIERARNAGCEALIVTVDAQIYGNREWHKRTTAGPKSLSWSSKFDALMDPRWFARGILTHGMPRFQNVIEFVPEHRRGFFDAAHWIRSQMDRALSWQTIARIRERWPRKLVIKGLLSVEDIARAAEIGADEVLVGRAALYGVAAAGKDGAKRALDILREEILRVLGLLGVPSIAELNPRLLVHSDQVWGGRRSVT